MWPSYALSFYRSQNVLCQSNIFVSDEKFIYILSQSQTFCARPKDDLHSVKLVFVLAQKFWRGTKCKFLEWLKTFGPVQNILGPVKGQGIRKHELYSSVPNKKMFQISIQDGNCQRNSLAYRPDFFSELIKQTGWKSLFNFFC